MIKIDDEDVIFFAFKRSQMRCVCADSDAEKLHPIGFALECSHHYPHKKPIYGATLLLMILTSLDCTDKCTDKGMKIAENIDIFD